MLLHLRVSPPPRALLLLLLSRSLLLRLWLAVSPAQVTTALTPDGTLGTTVTRRGNIYAITGGTRPGNGPNLFHSFERFSVGTGDTASFRGPQTGITHILSRVTGGQRSDIDGRLRSEMPGANLYLLNPAGVLFGPNASLDVSGSFHVSTADYLRLADGARFYARLSDTSTLSVAPPAAFGFVGPQPAPLSIQGSTLQVSEEQTVSVVGGDMQIVGGQLIAPRGRIQIASVAAAGEVIPETVGQAPDLQVDSFIRLGRIALSNALVDASGNGGGVVLVRGGRLLVDKAFLFADNLGPREGTGLGVDLGLTAEAVLTNGALITADSLGTGRARDLRLTAGSVHLEQGAQISSSTLGPGQGGTVRVTATDTLTLAGPSLDGRRPSGILTTAQGRGVGAGSAGSVVVQAPRLALTEGAQLGSTTIGPGQGGAVRVTATDTLSIMGESSQGVPSGLFSNTLAGTGRAGMLVVAAPHVEMAGGRIQTVSAAASRGAAGAIQMEVGTLQLTGGAQIVSSTAGPGQGGSVQITATDTLTLAGTSPDGRFPSGIFTTTQGTRVGAGNAGSVVIEAPRLVLTAGAQLGSSTLGPGQGGSVRVTTTDTLTLAGTSPDGHFLSGILAMAEGTEVGAGEAGAVVIAAQTVRIAAGAQISSSTLGPGQGGTVQVTATDTLSIMGESSQGAPSGLFSNALAGPGRAGMLVVAAPHVEMAGSRIEATSAAASRGDAGAIQMEVGTLQLTGGARIISSTLGPGQGGTVRVTATDTLTLAGTSPDGRFPSGIFVEAQGTEVGAGSAGSVVVQAPRLILTEGAQISSSTAGPGQGGTVQVTATNTLTLAGTSPDGRGPSGISAGAQGIEVGAGSAGSVVIEAPRLVLTEGAQIASNTAGPGQGGTVRVTATDTLTLAGISFDGRFPSGILATAQGTEVGAGEAGAVVVVAHTVRIAAGAQIASSTRGPGQGGTVTVTTADALTITGRDSGLRTTAASSGRGGDIVVDAHQVQLTAGTVISAESAGTGNAGSITITVRDMFLSQHSTVTTQASQADGGNIQLTAPRLIRLRDSQLTAAVGGGPTTVGGNISIDPQFVVLQNSQIVANAFQGRGGNIRIQAQQVFLADTASLVSASSTLGINGQVAIQAPVTSISGAVAPLPQAFARAVELLRSRCVERLREGTVSRFVLGGRDGVPLEPGSLLLSPPVQGEQPDPARIADIVAGTREASFVHVGELEVPNTGSLYLRGAHAQARWPGALDVECTK